MKQGFDPEYAALLLEKPGTQIWAYVSSFNGKKYFQIREMYADESGEWLPTKKGVSVPLAKLPAFMAALNDAAAFDDEDGEQQAAA